MAVDNNTGGELSGTNDHFFSTNEMRREVY